MKEEALAWFYNRILGIFNAQNYQKSQEFHDVINNAIQ